MTEPNPADDGHTFLVGIDVYADSDRDTARGYLYDALTAMQQAPGNAAPTTWWHADADRTDRSDRSLATFTPDHPVADALLTLPAAQRRILARALNDAIERRSLSLSDSKLCDAYITLADALGIISTD